MKGKKDEYRYNGDFRHPILKTKVFQSLEKYTGEEFQKAVMGQEMTIQKCTMIFDEKGDMTATLESSAEKHTC